MANQELKRGMDMKAVPFRDIENQFRAIQATLMSAGNAVDFSVDAFPIDIQTMVKYIHGHLFERRLTVDLVKRKCNLTNNNVVTKFRLVTGMGVREYITKHKLEAASNVLRETGVSIYLLASAAGYTEETFSRLFRKVYGCSPLDYRRGVLREIDKKNGQEKISREIVKSVVKKTGYLTFVMGMNIIFSFSEYAFAQGSWEWQNPLPQGADMFAVFALSPNRAVITGSGGTIITTEDGGGNWKIQRLPKVDWVRKSSFVSDTSGWAIGHWYDITNREGTSSRILRTNDGGMTWQQLSVSLDIDFGVYGLNEIEFTNRRVGYLLANPSAALPPEEQAPYPGLIYETEDSGIHWTKLNTGIRRKYNQLVFIDSSTGFLLSQPYYSAFDFDSTMLHRTEDGGKTWKTLSGRGYGRIHFVNHNIGWAGNYKTTDGGHTWNYQQFNFPPLENNVDKIWFTSGLIGYAISYRTILKTEDGGNSWAIQKETNNGLLQDIQFYDSKIGYVCGYGGTIYGTSDGGENWLRYGEGITNNLYDVDFADDMTGWVVGESGTILHTENGGKEWNTQESGLSDHFLAVSFASRNRGWIISGKHILHSDDGGKSWQVQYSSMNDSFRDLQFINESTGWVVGKDGLILKTANGGILWEREESGVQNMTIGAVWFVDSQTGWACGELGTILSTKNGGKTWLSKKLPSPAFLRCLQFEDGSTGWASDGEDYLAFFRTTDGGETWSMIPFGYYREIGFAGFRRFIFVNKNVGWSSSFFPGDIARTTDGGQTWTVLDRFLMPRILSIHFRENGIGWLVGDGGAIIKYKDRPLFSDSLFSPRVVNYPNPFNRRTTFCFYLSRAQRVSVVAYDVLGRKTRAIYDGPCDSGLQSIHWDAIDLSSGVYFVSVRCEEYTATARCLLVR